MKAFENFSLSDAGGESAPPAPKEEKSESSSSAPTPAPEPTPEPEESGSPSGKLETALDREPNISAQAKRLAIEKGVKLDGLKGTGKGGKITEEDVKKASSGPGAGAAVTAGAAYEDIPISSMRKTIANRLKESVSENPHYFVSSTLSVSKLMKLRQALNASSEGKYKLSVNDFLIKAIGVASKKVPQVNSSWRDGVIRQFNTVDVSVAVSTPVGLITPIVKSVEAKGLESISSSVKELAKRARDGKLKPEEYQGGSISISGSDVGGDCVCALPVQRGAVGAGLNASFQLQLRCRSLQREQSGKDLSHRALASRQGAHDFFRDSGREVDQEA